MDNMEYALIEISSNKILEKRFFEEIPLDVLHKGIKWLPINITRQSCDLNSQIEELPITTITNNSVEIVYPIKNLSFEEIRAKKFNEINNQFFGANIFFGIVLLNIYNEFRKNQNLSELNSKDFINLILDKNFFLNDTEENFIEYDKQFNKI